MARRSAARITENLFGMDATWLEDFIAVVREGGFSRAAGRRAISQPAFSRRIGCLEEWVGTPLFERAGRAVRLTDAGERFKPFAEEILRQLETGRPPTARLERPQHRKPRHRPARLFRNALSSNHRLQKLHRRQMSLCRKSVSRAKVAAASERQV